MHLCELGSYLKPFSQVGVGYTVPVPDPWALASCHDMASNPVAIATIRYFISTAPGVVCYANLAEAGCNFQPTQSDAFMKPIHVTERSVETKHNIYLCVDL